MLTFPGSGTAPAFGPDAFPSWPIWSQDEHDSILAALESGHWAGSRAIALHTFARDFARYQNAAIGLPLSNGTTTLEASLVACGVGEDDEVIVPAMTFVATATAVLRVNAVPVLVDVDSDSLCIDPGAVEAAFTERTRAVIAVHVAGAMCDMDRLVPLCRSRSVALIEDCAHAHGSRWRGVGAGSFGAFGSFSFQSSKLMTAGEGGVLVTSDPALADVAWQYANCGRLKNGPTYHHTAIASNCRMTEWQGAILAAQLRRYPDQLARRNGNALALADALSTIPGLRAQARDERVDSQGYYCFVIHYDPDEFAGLSRDGFQDALAEVGVPLSLAYPSLTDLALFRSMLFGPTRRNHSGFPDYRALHTGTAEQASATTVWIHHRALLADQQTVLRIAEVCSAIRNRAPTLTSAR